MPSPRVEVEVVPDGRRVGREPVEVGVAFVLYMPIKRETALPVPVAAADAADTANEAAEGGEPSSVSVEGVVLLLDEDKDA